MDLAGVEDDAVCFDGDAFVCDGADEGFESGSHWDASFGTGYFEGSPYGF